MSQPLDEMGWRLQRPENSKFIGSLDILYSIKLSGPHQLYLGLKNHEETALIERYTLPEMAAIWEPKNKFDIWLKVEILACEALANRREIPKSAVEEIKKKARFDISRIDEIEREVKHDVIAFLTCIAENVGESARYMHLGHDFVRCAGHGPGSAVERRRLVDYQRERWGFRIAVKKQALLHKNTPMIGRSHGIHGEPITFGFKLAIWYEELGRNIERLKRAKQRIAYGQISGAMGTFASIDPAVEEYVCKKLGLKPAPVSSQIIQRDRHAEYFSTLAILAGTLDKIAVEIRHLAEDRGSGSGRIFFQRAKRVVRHAAQA